MKKLKRYAAQLLFCFRTAQPKPSHKVAWTCESRIVLIKATSSRKALLQAKNRGKQLEWKNIDKSQTVVREEFIGVQELLVLEFAAEDENEVWYDIFTSKAPEKLIPKESNLSAIRCRTVLTP